VQVVCVTAYASLRVFRGQDSRIPGLMTPLVDLHNYHFISTQTCAHSSPSLAAPLPLPHESESIRSTPILALMEACCRREAGHLQALVFGGKLKSVSSIHFIKMMKPVKTCYSVVLLI
jgi:hypothetical protein